MTDRKKIPLFLACIPMLALASGLCNNAGIKTHFYLWELLLDGKTILLAALFFLILKPGALKHEAQKRGVFTWSLPRVLGAFMIPALIAGITLGAGLLAKKVSFANPDNGATLLLTMIFDIPAVFIFSITTVFVEEYVFRGYVLRELLKSGAPLAALAVSSALWALYAIVEVLPLEEFSWMSAGLLIFYYIAVGIAASGLYTVSRSLWVSYAFRIGVMTVTPSILSGVTGVTDAFFTTDTMSFYGDGIISSCLLMLFFAVFFSAARNRPAEGDSAFP